MMIRLIVFLRKLLLYKALQIASPLKSGAQPLVFNKECQFFLSTSRKVWKHEELLINKRVVSGANSGLDFASRSRRYAVIPGRSPASTSSRISLLKFPLLRQNPFWLYIWKVNQRWKLPARLAVARFSSPQQVLAVGIGLTSLTWFAMSVRFRLRYHLSPRPARHAPPQASQLSGTQLPDDFSCDAWRGPCLTGRGDNFNSNNFATTTLKLLFLNNTIIN